VQLHAVVDPLDVITERSEGDNELIIDVVKPDLVISSVDTYYYDQQRIVPAAVIYNIGEIPAIDVPFEFRMESIEGVSKYTTIIPYIDVDGHAVVSTEWSSQSLAAGSSIYYGVVDPDNFINEQDESNNYSSFTVKIAPDLTIHAGDIQASLTPNSGGEIEVTVRNWGNIPSPATTLILFEGPEIDTDKTPLFGWQIGSIPVDEFIVLQTTVDYIPYHLFALVDPDGAIEEIDESNNLSFTELPVINGNQVIIDGETDPNLLDIILSPPQSLDGSGQFEVSATGLLYDTSFLGVTDNLCEISSVIGTTDLFGKIALIEKGQCNYETQISNAAFLGAQAAVIYNDVSGGNLRETISVSTSSIPVGFLPRQDGLDLLVYHNHLVTISAINSSVTVINPYE